MKFDSFTIHSRSALVGAAISCAAWLAISALPQQSTSSRPLQVQLDPDPSLIVRLDDGVDYTVPSHKFLSIKSVFTGYDTAHILLNGVDVLAVGQAAGNPEQVTLAVPLVAQPGDVVTLVSTSPFPGAQAPVAFGYLSHN